MDTLMLKRILAGTCAVAALVAGMQVVPARAAVTTTVTVGVFPQFPTRVTLGSTGIPGSINLINGSSPPHATAALTVTELTLVPACGNFTPTCAGAADPRVFELDSRGTGGAGTGCAGVSFDVTVIDTTTGRVRFSRTDGAPLLLGRTDMTTELDTCLINFTFSNPDKPTIDSHPGVGELQTNQVGYLAVRHPDGTTGTDQGEDVTTVVVGTPPTTTSTTTTTLPPTTTTTTLPPTTTSTTTTTLPPTTTTTTLPPTTTTTTTTTLPPTTTTTLPPTTTSTLPPTTTSTLPPTTTTTTTKPPTTTTTVPPTTTTTTKPPTTTTTVPPTTTT
ncbi:MAG: hypothetical protein ACRD12_17640, partial [Acidimicrobiales bacterium]